MGIIHNLLTPPTPAANAVECSCGWRVNPGEIRLHLDDVAKESRDRIIEFVDFVEEEVGTGNWRDIDMFASNRDFLTPAGFVTAMDNLGFKSLRQA